MMLPNISALIEKFRCDRIQAETVFNRKFFNQKLFFKILTQRFLFEHYNLETLT